MRGKPVRLIWVSPYQLLRVRSAEREKFGKGEQKIHELSGRFELQVVSTIVHYEEAVVPAERENAGVLWEKVDYSHLGLRKRQVPVENASLQVKRRIRCVPCKLEYGRLLRFVQVDPKFVWETLFLAVFSEEFQSKSDGLNGCRVVLDW